MTTSFANYRGSSIVITYFKKRITLTYIRTAVEQFLSQYQQSTWESCNHSTCGNAKSQPHDPTHNTSPTTLALHSSTCSHLGGYSRPPSPSLHVQTSSSRKIRVANGTAALRLHDALRAPHSNAPVISVGRLANTHAQYAHTRVLVQWKEGGTH